MKLEGELREIDLIGKLIELSDAQFTGAVRFEHEGESVIKIIYFKGGNVLSASTNDRADSIDEILLKSSKVSREHIKQALARRKENETLGDALLTLGFITRKELAWVRRVQLIGIIRSLQRWDSGGYTIVSDYLPKREEGTIFNLPQIVVEVIVTEQDRARIEKEIGGSEQLFARTEGSEERYLTLGLNDDADRIYSRIDGLATAEEIAASSGMDAFSVFKLLYAFRTLGVIQPASNPQVIPQLPELMTAETDDLLDSSETITMAPLPSLGDTWTPPLDEDSTTAAIPLPTKAERNDLSLLDEPYISTAPSPIDRRPIISAPPPRKSKKALILVIAALLLAGAGFAAYHFLAASSAGPAITASLPRRPHPLPTSPPPQTAVAAPNTDTVQPTATESLPLAQPSSTAVSSVPSSSIQPIEQPPVASPKPIPSQAGSTTDPERERFNAIGRQNQSAQSAPYTIQVAFLCQTSSLKSSLASGGSELWFVPVQRGGAGCYRLYWGHFGSRGEAVSAAGSVPAAFKSGRPVIVKTASAPAR